MEFLILLLIIVAFVVALYYLLTGLLGMQYRVVPEEKRLVIYRLGRFQRIAGPGVVITWRTDTIEREINVRDEPVDLRVENLYMKGIPFGYTLNLWLHTDPVTVAQGDQERLRELALFNDRERQQQIAVKLRESIVKVVADIEKSYKLSKDALTFEKLLPIFPGLPLCEQLLEALKAELQRTLPTIGVVVNQQQPITITALHLSPTIINGFKQGHIANLLREQYPDLASERILRSVATIDGIDLQEQRVVLDGDGDMRASMDFRQGKDGVESRLKTYLPSAGGAKESRRHVDTTAVEIADGEILSEADLQILKPIPIYQPPKRAAGS